jgi:uncharacterized protein YndB with AHSA1/START domain
MMTERTVTHASFTIERVFDAPPRRVFHAFADTKAKESWFAGPAEWGPNRHAQDFRVGGRESNSVAPEGGEAHVFEALYYDIVPDERIIYSYEMFIGDKHISVSLASVEFKPAGTGTKLILTEHGAYLDGWDFPAQREEGTKWLLDKLGASLAA